MEARTKRVVLLLADISGYTKFMLSHEKALAHSQMIIGGLLESLMEQIDHPIMVVELEGDALFLYSEKSEDIEAWDLRRKHLRERILQLFEIFHRRLAELAAYSVCHCEACAHIGDLKLKVVVHSGEALLSKVDRFPVLAGPDVIAVHRLLKNSVEAAQYVLMTESARQDLPVPEGVDLIEGTEEYDIGTFKTFTFIPDVAVEFGEAAIRKGFSDDNVAVKILRHEIQKEYTEVACEPTRGYHFNIGRAALQLNEYDPDWFAHVPEDVVASYAGTGNPFALGELHRGEHVVDIGSGAGLDCMVAAGMVGAEGHVIGVEMTPAMIEKARIAGQAFDQVEFREGFAESLPVPDRWADVVISNGVVNLSPDKARVFAEMLRVLRPGGRLQIADITVLEPVPERARRDIDLWTN